jgi:RNA polymerase sigma-70 factor, ECF subfamily
VRAHSQEASAAVVLGGEVRDPSEPFAAFFEAEYARVVTICRALVGAWGEDVAQEAFVRAFLRWRSVQAMQRPDAWVRRVAVNLAYSRLRRIAAEARALTRLRLVRGGQDGEDADSSFWEAVRTLPPRQAQAFALHYADDLSVADVAVVMQCAEGTVKAHLHAARTSLAQLLAARGAPA